MHILDFNHCREPRCRCGWNVSIGGKSEEELEQLRNLLKDFLGPVLTIDYTNYHEKMGTERFLPHITNVPIPDFKETT